MATKWDRLIPPPPLLHIPIYKLANNRGWETLLPGEVAPVEVILPQYYSTSSYVQTQLATFPVLKREVPISQTSDQTWF